MLKSRVNWMIQGDCNTSFYHTSTLARRKRNHIASVMDDRGEWITNIREVTEFFHRGFFSLYAISHESTSHIPHQTVQWHGHLTDEVKSSLDTTVFIKEIKDALWSMKPYKALGPDGLYAGFFQIFWFLIGDSVIREVERVFTTKKVPNFLHKTLIVLIPKI